jgi:hypothetical protein
MTRPLVLLCAVVYLGSAAHFALVQHATCLEHGEIIHVDGLRDRSEPQESDVEAASTDERLFLSNEDSVASGDDEDRCTQALIRRDGPAVSGWCLYTLRFVPETRSSFALEQVLPEPVARLLLAPKSSPPRA